MKNLTTETRRHGEESGDLVIARDRVIGAHDSKNRFFEAPLTRSPDHPITRSPARLFNAWNVFLSALREIFDESAYERFLLRTNTPRSTASYREFLREQESGIARKPRCC
jgi:hypothetical protein